MSLVEKLIEEVRCQECLYNLKSPLYRSTDIKEEKWRDISRKLGLEVHICKSKWKSLRDRFRKEVVKKYSTSRNKGKPWPFMEALYFLQNADCTKKAITDMHFKIENKDVFDVNTDISNDEDFKASHSFSEVLINERNDSFIDETIDETDNSFKSFSKLVTDSLKNPPVNKTPIAMFLESIAAQINAGNVSPFKLFEFQKTVLNATYEAISPESE